jgi:hypothetical protein
VFPTAEAGHFFGVGEQGVVLGHAVEANLTGDFQGDGADPRLLIFGVRHGKDGGEPVAQDSGAFGGFAADPEIQIRFAGGGYFQKDGLDRRGEQRSDFPGSFAQYFRDGAAQNVGHFFVGAEDL